MTATKMAFRGLGLHLWYRYRLGAAIYAIWLGLVIVLANAVPVATLSNGSLTAFMIPLFAMFPFVIAVFAHPDADGAGTEPGYPSHLYVLPVSSNRLAAIPMLLGAATLFFHWICLSFFIMHPREIHSPNIWPAFLLIALLFLLQALFWTSMSFPFQRLALVLIGISVLIFGGIYGHFQNVSESSLSISYIFVALICFMAATKGLTKSRCGTTVQWKFTARSKRKSETLLYKSPFRSPLQAEAWSEWELHGKAYIIVTLCICTVVALPLFFTRTLLPISSPSMNPSVSIQNQTAEMNGWVRLFIPVVLMVPLWIGAVAGCGIRKTNVRRKDLTLDPFLAARPLSTAKLVLVKWIMAARCAIKGCAIAIAFAGVGSLFPVHVTTPAPLSDDIVRMIQQSNTHHSRQMSLNIAEALRASERNAKVVDEPLFQYFIKQFPARWVTILLFTILILVFLTWRNQIVGGFADLTGRPWVAYGFAIVVPMLIPLLASLVGRNWMEDPTRIPKIIEYLPALGEGLFVLKMAVAMWAFWQLARLRLLTVTTLTASALAWLAISLGFALCLTKMLPEGLAQPGNIILGCALFVPLARPALAPLALEWNRRR